MKIKVTDEHIARGERRSHTYCPVARAMRDAGLQHPSVGYVFLYWTDNAMPIPDSVYGFIRAFDDGRPVKPFEFELGG